MLSDLLLNESVVSAYIDANLLLFVIFALWWLAARILSRIGLEDAYAARLRLLNSVMLAGALCPLVIYLASGITSQYAFNFSDIIVAHYLDGDFEMKPSTMQFLIDAPSGFVRDFVNQSDMLMVCLAVIIATGTLGFTIKAIINVLALRRLLKSCHPLRRLGSVSFLISDTVLVPFSTRGLRQRYIVIPAIMLDNMVDVKMAISHELQHFRQRDIEWDVALAFLQPLFFWNPAFLILKRQLERFRELSCDQSILNRQNLRANDYARCLIALCEQPPNPRDLHLVQVGFFKNSLAKRDLMRRVQAICNSETSSHRMPWFYVRPLRPSW